MSKHLLRHGFTPFYHVWNFHGEKLAKRARMESQQSRQQSQPGGEFDTGFHDCLAAFVNANAPESPHVEAETPQEAETSEEPEENTKK